eukprot:jgi/Chlat1/8409/Chrsp80S07840
MRIRTDIDKFPAAPYSISLCFFLDSVADLAVGESGIGGADMATAAAAAAAAAAVVVSSCRPALLLRRQLCTPRRAITTFAGRTLRLATRLDTHYNGSLRMAAAASSDSAAGACSLANKNCVPCEGGIPPLSQEEIDRLKEQVPNWRVTRDAEGRAHLLRHVRTKNFAKGLQLFERVGEVAEAEGHHPDLHLQSYNQVRIELCTHSAGGLTENDFIMAAKLDALDVTDLLSKKQPAAV